MNGFLIMILALLPLLLPCGIIIIMYAHFGGSQRKREWEEKGSNGNLIDLFALPAIGAAFIQIGEI